MKNLQRESTKFILLFIVCFLSSQSALADKIKVKKVKGKNAIVESTLQLEEGQTYELVPDSLSQNVDYAATVLKSRSNSLSFGTQLAYLKSDTTETTSLALQTRYGWNFSNLELGVLADLTSVDNGNGATTSILAGGYFDYNLVPNRDPKKVIYGPFVLAGFGTTSVPSSNLTGSTTKVEANAGGFLSYFIADSTTALRSEVFFDYQQTNTSALSTSITGVGGRILLSFYF
jgi:hypothetical protein